MGEEDTENLNWNQIILEDKISRNYGKNWSVEGATQWLAHDTGLRHSSCHQQDIIIIIVVIVIIIIITIINTVFIMIINTAIFLFVINISFIIILAEL